MDTKKGIVFSIFGLVLIAGIGWFGCDSGGGGGGGEAPGPYECGDGPACGADRYADGLTAGAIHVNACCPSDVPDGSLEKPYETIGEALAAASSGDMVAVAAGTYGPLKITESIELLGAGAQRCALVSAAGGDTVLEVSGAGQVSVSGFLVLGDADLLSEDCLVSPCVDRNALEMPSEIGILVLDSEGVSLTDLAVTGHGKVGVEFAGSSGALQGSTVHGNGSGTNSVGLVVVGGSTVTIGSGDDATGPEASPCIPPACGSRIEENNGLGVYVHGSTASLHDTLLRANLGGGAFFEVSTADGAPSQIGGNRFEGNTGFGLYVRSHSVEILDNDFEGTLDCDGNCAGHCLTVTGDEPSSWPLVTVRDNDLIDCSGSGILLDGSLIATVEDNWVIAAQRWGGIWAQGGVDITSLSGNTVDDTALVGIAVTTGSRAQIIGNEIRNTWTESYYDFASSAYVDLADGIVVADVTDLNGVFLESNDVMNSERAGIIIDNAASDYVNFAMAEGLRNSVTGSGEVAVVVQNGSQSIGTAQELVGMIEGVSDSAEVVSDLDTVFPIAEGSEIDSQASPCVPPFCG